MRRWLLLGLVLTTVTCQSRVPPTETTVEASVELQALPHALSGGRFVLARLNGKKVGVLADPEDRSVHVLDLEAMRFIATFPFEGRPEALLVGPAGTIWAIDRDANAVVELALAANQVLLERRRITTAPEPVGLGISPDGEELFVSSRGDALLERISVVSPQTRRSSDAGHEPRSVTVLDDGTPVVGHASTRSEGLASIASKQFVGSGSVPSTKMRIARRERLNGQAFAPATDGERVFVAFDVIDRDEPHSVEGKATESNFGYGGPVRPSLGGQAAIQGPDGTGTSAWLDNCNLPRAAAFDRAQGILYVACTGTNRVASVRYRPTGEDPELGDEEGSVQSPLQFDEGVMVPSGPLGLALDPELGQVWVWSEFAREVSVIRDGKAERALTIPHSASYDVAIAEGRRLFHDAQDPRISSSGFACASCHPDGGDDSQVWLVKDGKGPVDTLRQTPTLAGRVRSTDRFGWRGEDATLEAHLSRTIRRLEGFGISDTARKHLAAYVKSLQTSSRPTHALTTLEARGQSLFESEELGCSSCHTEHGLHGGAMGVIRAGGPLRTPSLLSVSHTAPYLHDGSAETLSDVLELKSRALELSLTPEQSSALLAYLTTL